MGTYLTPGHTYIDGSTVTGPNLTEHVAEAIFNTTAITDQTLKDPAELTDRILAVDSDEFVQLTLQQVHDLILYPGSVVQTVFAEYTANTNLTAVIPIDDTVPQNTEGTEIVTASITPRFSDSTILVSFNGSTSCSNINNVIVALFRDAVVSAIRSNFVTFEVATQPTRPLAIVKMDAPTTTSAVTYRIRVGPGAAGTVRMNGSTTGRYLGGTMAAMLTLQEIKV